MHSPSVLGTLLIADGKASDFIDSAGHQQYCLEIKDGKGKRLAVGMSLCIYLCNVCICICIHVYIYVYPNLCVNFHAYICINICVHIHVFMYILYVYI